jgi:hypothetical protein
MAKGMVGLVLALLAIGCDQSTTSIPAASPALERDQLETPRIVVTEEEIAEEVDVRGRYGLRSDRTWVREVAANPAAQIGMEEYGVPLMPDEFADLMSRRWDPNLHLQVSEYGGRFPDDFGGAWINMKANSGVIAFKNNVDHHREALANIVPEGSVLQVVKVDWSVQDLESFVDRIEGEKAWFDAIGVEARANAYSMENSVHIRFEGPQEAADVIARHFGHAQWLTVDWGGPLPWQGPRGDLTIKVVDANGRPVSQIRIDVRPVHPMVEWSGETVFGTDAAGICVIRNVPIAVYEVTLHEWVGNDHYDSQPTKSVRIGVRPGGASTTLVVPTR